VILEAAWRIHVKACDPFRVPAEPPFVGLDARKLAQPFGTPEGMPPHHWIVSSDVLQALYEAAPPPMPGIAPLQLFGWPIVQDEDAPAQTLRLEADVVQRLDL
jgi:hypothetical protein